MPEVNTGSYQVLRRREPPGPCEVICSFPGGLEGAPKQSTLRSDFGCWVCPHGSHAHDEHLCMRRLEEGCSMRLRHEEEEPHLLQHCVQDALYAAQTVKAESMHAAAHADYLAALTQARVM